MPKVSVVISAYNSAKYIRATVESVLAQTFKDYELIVVDDGSTDETGQILHEYEGRLSYIYQENKKYSGARNTGIRAASGEYIAFLDSDDLWRPEKLEHQVAVMDRHPHVTLAYCQAVYIDPQGNPTQFQGQGVKGASGSAPLIFDPLPELFFGTMVTTSTAMVRRSTLQEVGPFDDAHIHGEDWELWVRLASKGPFAYLPEPLAQYRIYGWHKILAVEILEEWVTDQFRSLDRVTAVWPGDIHERDHLRALGAATIYTRAALSSFQVGRGAQGQAYLAQALSANPELSHKDNLVQLAVDRAKLIEIETGSNEQATAFIHTFFSNLPQPVAHYSGAYKETLGWLYIGGAFEQRQRGDKTAVKRLLAQGIAQSPACLKNRGVLSIALEAWLGNTVVDKLRQAKTILSGARH